MESPNIMAINSYIFESQNLASYIASYNYLAIAIYLAT